MEMFITRHLLIYLLALIAMYGMLMIQVTTGIIRSKDLDMNKRVPVIINTMETTEIKS